MSETGDLENPGDAHNQEQFQREQEPGTFSFWIKLRFLFNFC